MQSLPVYTVSTAPGMGTYLQSIGRRSYLSRFHLLRSASSTQTIRRIGPKRLSGQWRLARLAKESSTLPGTRLLGCCGATLHQLAPSARRHLRLCPTSTLVLDARTRSARGGRGERHRTVTHQRALCAHWAASICVARYGSPIGLVGAEARCCSFTQSLLVPQMVANLFMCGHCHVQPKPPLRSTDAFGPAARCSRSFVSASQGRTRRASTAMGSGIMLRRAAGCGFARVSGRWSFLVLPIAQSSGLSG